MGAPRKEMHRLAAAHGMPYAARPDSLDGPPSGAPYDMLPAIVFFGPPAQQGQSPAQGRLALFFYLSVRCGTGRAAVTDKHGLRLGILADMREDAAVPFQSLLGGLGIPEGGLRGILRHAEAHFIAGAQEALGLAIALFGGTPWSPVHRRRRSAPC